MFVCTVLKCFLYFMYVLLFVSIAILQELLSVCCLFNECIIDVDTGASVTVADEEGDTCLHYAVGRQTATMTLDNAPSIRQVCVLFIP